MIRMILKINSDDSIDNLKVQVENLSVVSSNRDKDEESLSKKPHFTSIHHNDMSSASTSNICTSHPCTFLQYIDKHKENIRL